MDIVARDLEETVHPTSPTRPRLHNVRSHGPPSNRKWQKRSNEDVISSDARASPSLSPTPDDLPQPRLKKPKRAETRPCPVCSELIPIRLLAAHAELEMQRVEDIMSHIGDTEVLAEVDDLEEGPSGSKRRSALRARQSLTALQPLPRIRASSSALSITLFANTTTTAAAIEHTIGYITRRRKARHARLKELAKEEATWFERNGAGNVDPEGEGIICPVCSQRVRGDRDVVEAHVDACLAHESQRAQAERERERIVGLVPSNEDADVDVDVNTGWDGGEGGSVRTRVITNANLRGSGIHIRPSTMDTEDDIDVDGTDDAVFGDAQFGEADVQKVEWGASVDVDEVAAVRERSNHDRQARSTNQMKAVSEEDMDKLDTAIVTARSRGDNQALIAALEAKLNAVPASPTCRICLSPYIDPTLSTGCWHTCCATCWLRCLGATKLCPMCQRITGASELRRVYL